MDSNTRKYAVKRNSPKSVAARPVMGVLTKRYHSIIQDVAVHRTVDNYYVIGCIVNGIVIQESHESYKREAPALQALSMSLWSQKKWL